MWYQPHDTIGAQHHACWDERDPWQGTVVPHAGAHSKALHALVGMEADITLVELCLMLVWWALGTYCIAHGR